jgi:hypothetical protein
VYRYYKSIHPLLPILHHSRVDLRSHLTKCSLTLRDTFLHLLYATVRVASKRNEADVVDEELMKKAFDIIQASQFENPKNRSTSVNLIYLQCAILASLEADQRGPENFRGKSGVHKTHLLQMAVTLGSNLLKHYKLDGLPQPEGDRDSVKNLIRRNWIILVVLDRFNAISTGTLKIIPRETARFSILDKPLLGDTLFNLAGNCAVNFRLIQLIYFIDLTDVMSQIIGVIDLQNSPGSSQMFLRNPQVIKELVESELDRGSRIHGIFPPQTADQTSGNPNFDTVGLLWWHLVLISKRHLYIMHPIEILMPAKVMVDILKQQTSSGPFHFHFFALAAITLLELTGIPEVEEAAWKSVSDLQIAMDRRQTLPLVPSSRSQSPKTTNGKLAYDSSSKDGVYIHANTTPGWDDAISNLVTRKQQQKASNLPLPDSSHQAGQVTSPNANSTSPVTANAASAEGRSLQQLADLAERVGGTNIAGGDNAQDGAAPGASSAGANEGKATSEPVTIDFTLLTRHGYLSVLV